MEAVESYTYKKHRIEVHYDENSENPRTYYDHCSVMFLVGGRNNSDVDEVEDNLPRKYIWQSDKRFSVEEPVDDDIYWEEVSITKPDSFCNWDEVEEAVKLLYPGCVLLSVYKYEHGGVAFNTTGFSCPWDSGQVGYILVTKEVLDHEWNGDREKAESCLKAEVAEYSAWANGDVYRYEVYAPSETEDEDEDDDEKEPSTELLDSCCGYTNINECKKEAEDYVNYAEVEAAKVAAGVCDDEEEG